MPVIAPRYVGVIGGRTCGAEIGELACQVGAEIARRGWVLVCGGMGGVMQEACRGARSAGGVTLGILPGHSRAEGNPYLSYSIITGLGEARNVLVARNSEALIAVAGGYGTLSEIALANNARLPVVGLRSWKLKAEDNSGLGLFSLETEDPAEAVRFLAKYFAERRGPGVWA